MKKQIEKLAKALAEKRSDIWDILNKIAQGEKWSVRDIEHRFIRAEIPQASGHSITLEYDTLTTTISYFNVRTGEWETAINHRYSN